MQKISKVWFEEGRIYVLTDSGNTYSRPLEAFPTLKEAGERERQDFKIGKFGDSAKEISNFFTIRHKKALHIGVQGFCLNGY